MSYIYVTNLSLFGLYTLRQNHCTHWPEYSNTLILVQILFSKVSICGKSPYLGGRDKNLKL